MAAGQVDGELGLGGLLVHGPIIVAPIGSLQGVIGLDFLEKLQVKIDLKSGVLEIGKHAIFMHKKIAPGCCRIAVKRVVTIPAKAEIQVMDRLIVVHH